MELKTLISVAVILLTSVAANNGRSIQQEQLDYLFREMWQRSDFTRESIPKKFLPHLESFGQVDLFQDGYRASSEDPIDTLLCESCSAAMDRIITAVNDGIPLEDIEQAAARFCKLLNVVDDVVCDGIVVVFGPILEFMIKDMGPRATPELFCGVFISSACLSEELDNEVNGWTVELPATVKPPYSPPLTPEAGAGTVRALLFTDVHLDLTYTEGSPQECGLPCCCLASTGLATGEQTPAPYWGSYSKCDLPLRTLDEMFKQVVANIGQLDYAIFTGDAPAHDVWAQTKESNFAHESAVIELFKENFPDLPLYITLGNHEGLPVNVYSTDAITDPNFDMKWLYDGVGDLVAQYLAPEALTNFRATGSYVARPYPGFKIVSLNNNYGHNQNFAIYNNFTDPQGQLAWLIAELQAAEDDGEMVHILTHHPSASLLPGYEREFSKIIVRYENIVQAILVGHKHNDYPEVWINDEGIPSVMTYINPSSTPYSRGQPMFRVFTFDGGYAGASWQVMDIDTYSTDIEAYSDQETPLFELLYNSRETFSMNALLAPDWLDVLTRAVEDDEVFENLVRFDYQNREWELPENRTDYLCARLYHTDECLFGNRL